eukprot:gene16035-19017_t
MRLLTPSHSIGVGATEKDGEREVPVKGGQGQRRHVDQQRVRRDRRGSSLSKQIHTAARRRSFFANLVSTESTLTLSVRDPAEDRQPAGSVAEDPAAGVVVGNGADDIPNCHAQSEASVVRRPSAREQSAVDGVPSKIQELGGGPVLESYHKTQPNMLTAIGLNVYQLHLSVPLVHLEEVPLRSRQAKPVVCAERGGNAKGAVQGRDPVTQEDIGLPAGGSVVENYKEDVEGEDAVALLQKGALGCGEGNTFVLMLVLTVWFFYSKAVNCCTDFRAFLACPEARGDLQAVCLGSSSCTALAGASAGDELPAELQAEDFVCRAFPQGTITDRVYVMLMIIGIITPVTLALSQLFITAASAEVPGHWGRRITKRTESVLGATVLAAVQTAFVAAYALLFNFQKFNKAVAMALVTLIGMFLKA